MKITGQVLFLYLSFANYILFVSKNDGANTFSYHLTEGAYAFFQAKNHGAKTFSDGKIHRTNSRVSPLTNIDHLDGKI